MMTPFKTQSKVFRKYIGQTKEDINTYIKKYMTEGFYLARYDDVDNLEGKNYFYVRLNKKQ